MSELDLVQEELRELATRRSIEAAGIPTEPFGHVLLPTRRARGRAGPCRRAAWCSTSGSATPASCSTPSTAAYEPSTVFLVVLDHRRRLPAGMARMTLPSPSSGSRRSPTSSRCGDTRSPTCSPRRGSSGTSPQVWDVAHDRGDARLPRQGHRRTDSRSSMLQSGSQGLLHDRRALHASRVLDLVVLDLVQRDDRPSRISAFPGIEPDAVPRLTGEHSRVRRLRRVDAAPAPCADPSDARAAAS